MPAPLVKGLARPQDDYHRPEDKDPMLHYWVAVSEVLKLSRLKGMRVFIRVEHHAPNKDQTRAQPDHVLGRQVTGFIKTPKLEFYKFIDQAYSEKTRETHLVEISINSNMLFVG